MGRKVRIHKGCGGVIKGNVCTRCKKSFGKFTRMFRDYSYEKEETFDEQSHRRRIREGQDIWK